MKVLSLIMAFFLLIACSEQSQIDLGEPAPKSGKTKKDKKAPDISKMELEKGLRTKYSLLRFKCKIAIERTLLEKEKKKEGELGKEPKEKLKTYRDSEEIVVWDILEDFTQDNKNHFVSFGLKDIDVELDWNLQLTLVNKLSQKDYTKKGQFLYRLKNAAIISGRQTIRVFKTNLKGESKTLIGENDPQMTFSDRIPVTVLDNKVGNSLDRFKTKASCLLQAHVKKGFEKEFTVEKI